MTRLTLRAAALPEGMHGLERLLDEYSTADGLDPARRDRLIASIRTEAQALGVEADLGLPASASAAATMAPAPIDDSITVNSPGPPPWHFGWRAPWSAILSCVTWRPFPLPGLQRRQMSGALRIVPSPEQGTSRSGRGWA